MGGGSLGGDVLRRVLSADVIFCWGVAVDLVEMDSVAPVEMLVVLVVTVAGAGAEGSINSIWTLASDGDAVFEAGGDLEDRSLPRGVSVVAATGDGLEVKNCERGLLVNVDLGGCRAVLVLVGVSEGGRGGNSVSSSMKSAIV